MEIISIGIFVTDQLVDRRVQYGVGFPLVAGSGLGFTGVVFIFDLNILFVTLDIECKLFQAAELVDLYKVKSMQ